MALPGFASLPAAAVLPLAFVGGLIAAHLDMPERTRASVRAAQFGVATSCLADSDLDVSRALAQCFVLSVVWMAFYIGMQTV